MKKSLLLSVCALGLSATAAQADVPLALDLHAGTLGGGLGLTIGINDKLNARVGGSFFSISADAEGDDDPNTAGSALSFDGDLDLASGQVLADWHPFSGGFRISGGLFLNGNEFSASARCNDTANGCEVGGQNFSAADIGVISAVSDFDSVVPYVGIGWGNAVEKNKTWGFQADLGVVFQGETNIQLSQQGGCVTGNAAQQAQCRSDVDNQLAEEQRQINDDLDEFDIYPLLSIGVTYRFR